ncbi:MAG TPA: hypothetical protein VJB38_00735 [Bacteroidota bacterium]|nr:hypothetical protein [Bacteroidota bacterium]
MTEVITIALSLLFVSPETTDRQQKEKTKKDDVVTFEDTIAPILKKNCTPCHFEGGKMFEKHPFNKYETVRDLGKKLGTRLKGENGRLLTLWIESGSPNKKSEGQEKP